jgi:hypothetical protein
VSKKKDIGLTSIVILMAVGYVIYFAYFLYLSMEKSPAILEPKVLSTKATFKVTSEELQAKLRKDIDEQRNRVLREKSSDTPMLKDGVKGTEKSFLERFIWGDDSNEEQKQ